MSTTLDPNFLTATMLMESFKGGQMKRTQGALLTLALEADGPITAADLPGEITRGDLHLAGAATGALIALDLLVVVGRIKSPLASAKGRKLNQLNIPLERRATARTWLARQGFPPARTRAQQLTLLSA
jgi:hypothetical protein